MALQANGVVFSLFHQKRPFSVKAVASESVSVLRGGEEMVKLGRSGVRVTKLGVGAWSWGDTIYWNDSKWDGEGKPIWEDGVVADPCKEETNEPLAWFQPTYGVKNREHNMF